MYFRVHAPELSAGSDGKGPHDRFPGKVVSHGALMHHSQMPRRLPLRVVNGNGQVALYPIFLQPMILWELLLDMVVSEDILTGRSLDIVFENIGEDPHRSKRRSGPHAWGPRSSERKAYLTWSVTAN